MPEKADPVSALREVVERLLGAIEAHDEPNIWGWSRALRTALSGEAPDREGDDQRVPHLLQIGGTVGGNLIVGTDWRVTEIRSRVEPSGVEGEPDAWTTVIRFDPLRAPSLEGARHPEAGETVDD